VQGGLKTINVILLGTGDTGETRHQGEALTAREISTTKKRPGGSDALEPKDREGLCAQ